MWGGGKVLAMADPCSESTSSSNNPPVTPQVQKVRGKPRKSTTEENRGIIAALQSGKTVDRNEQTLCITEIKI